MSIEVQILNAEANSSMRSRGLMRKTYIEVGGNFILIPEWKGDYG